MDHSYPVRFERAEGEIGLIFPDFPEIASWHPDTTSNEDLRGAAADALLVALHTRVMENDEIPPPSGGKGCDFHVPVGPLVTMKLMLAQKLREQGLSRRALAARLGKSSTIANRLLDLTHNSAVPQLEAAMSVLGQRFVISAAPRQGSHDHGDPPSHGPQSANRP